MSRTIKQIPWDGSLPDCDFCVSQGRQPIRPGPYDFKTNEGPWANGCLEHMRQHSPAHTSLINQRVPRKGN